MSTYDIWNKSNGSKIQCDGKQSSQHSSSEYEEPIVHANYS